MITSIRYWISIPADWTSIHTFSCCRIQILKAATTLTLVGIRSTTSETGSIRITWRIILVTLRTQIPIDIVSSGTCRKTGVVDTEEVCACRTSDTTEGSWSKAGSTSLLSGAATWVVAWLAGPSGCITPVSVGIWIHALPRSAWVEVSVSIA